MPQAPTHITPHKSIPSSYLCAPPWVLEKLNRKACRNTASLIKGQKLSVLPFISSAHLSKVETSDSNTLQYTTFQFLIIIADFYIREERRITVCTSHSYKYYSNFIRFDCSCFDLLKGTWCVCVCVMGGLLGLPDSCYIQYRPCLPLPAN